MLLYDFNVSYGSINVLLGPLDVVEPQKLHHSRIWEGSTLANGKKPLSCGSLYMAPLVDAQGQETEAVCVPL